MFEPPGGLGCHLLFSYSLLLGRNDNPRYTWLCCQNVDTTLVEWYGISFFHDFSRFLVVCFVFRYRDTYPYRPMDLKFISRVLLAAEGAVHVGSLVHNGDPPCDIVIIYFHDTIELYRDSKNRCYDSYKKSSVIEDSDTNHWILGIILGFMMIYGPYLIPIVQGTIESSHILRW